MIRLDGVTMQYPDGTLAVDDLSLTVPDREITVLVGPSGCGKTTTLRMINRWVEPTSGRVRIDGPEVTSMDAAQLRRGIGYVIQHGGLFPHHTVERNVAAVPMLLGTSKKQALARARELLELVGLDPALGRRYPSQLSGGQQQRVAVARALVTRPEVIFADEPTGALDQKTGVALLEYLMRHSSRVVGKIELLDHVWDGDAEDLNVVEVYVGYLRRKLGRDAVTTVRGAGYRVAG